MAELQSQGDSEIASYGKVSVWFLLLVLYGNVWTWWFTFIRITKSTILPVCINQETLTDQPKACFRMSTCTADCSDLFVLVGLGLLP